MFGLSALVLIVTLPLVIGLFVPRRARLLVWTLVVILGVVPWASWVGHSHWDRVEWGPFTGTFRLRDIVLNVLFYVPIGFFFVRDGLWRWKGTLAGAVAFGLLLSLGTEFTQVFGHGRFPSMTDVLTNTSGAAAGAWLADVLTRGPAGQA